MMIPMLSFNILNLDFGYPTKPIKYVFSFSYLLSCSTDQTTNSESTNPEFWKIVTYQICVFADKTKENQETMLVKLAIIGLKIYDNSNS